MSFFQNPFGEEFRQSWPIGQDCIIFIGANVNNIGHTMVAWNLEPYNFTGISTLTINYAYDPTRKLYSSVDVVVSGAVVSATLASEVAAALNANVTFATYFEAFIINSPGGPISAGPPYRVAIRCKKEKQNIRYYVSNPGAEIALNFNKKAPVKELPTYFVRHTVANRFIYPDSQACLIELNPLDPVDAAIIEAAGLDPLAPLADWEILHGRSIVHQFRKITLDGSLRIESIIEYPAGSVVGDMAKLYQFVYTGANTIPDQIAETPYTLTSGDLITP